MEFERPDILPADVIALASLYPFGEPLSYSDLGGIPNQSIKVETHGDPFVIRVYGKGQSTLEHIEFELQLLEQLARLNFPAPRLIRGRNGKLLQQWNGFWVSASVFIEGMSAEKISLTPRLVESVGELVSSFESSVANLSLRMPSGESFIERGELAIRSLPKALGKRGWMLEGADSVDEQWKQASRHYLIGCSAVQPRVIHADIWPPNVICMNDQVVGLVDFDDCCLGQPIIDLSLALMEFSMFQDVVMREDLALSLFVGYLRNQEPLFSLNSSVIISIMEMACAMWFSYNVIQAPTVGEAEIYLRRLNLMSDVHYRGRLVEKVDRLIAEARMTLDSQTFGTG